MHAHMQTGMLFGLHYYHRTHVCKVRPAVMPQLPASEEQEPASWNRYVYVMYAHTYVRITNNLHMYTYSI